MADTLVRLARTFRGPRHSRCYKIWADWEKRTGNKVSYLDDLGPIGHEQAFKTMWQGAYDGPERFVILTESDFLPDDDMIENATIWGPNPPAGMGVSYYSVREPDTWKLIPCKSPTAGGWWMILDKEQVPRDVDFGGPDPGNRLQDQLDPFWLMDGVDMAPSIYYPGIGLHLFWSRAYNDPPWSEHAGFKMSEVLGMIDKYLTRWERHGGI